MQSLLSLAQDKKSAFAREGSLLAFERLFDELGSLFEPYVAQTLPQVDC